MTIIKYQFNGVSAYRFDSVNIHEFFTHLQYFLSGPVSTHLGRRRVDPQKFAGQHAFSVIVKMNFEQAGALMELNQDGHWTVWMKAAHRIEESGDFADISIMRMIADASRLRMIETDVSLRLIFHFIYELMAILA